jgi:hypothetical protein
MKKAAWNLPHQRSPTLSSVNDTSTWSITFQGNCSAKWSQHPHPLIDQTPKGCGTRIFSPS